MPIASRKIKCIYNGCQWSHEKRDGHFANGLAQIGMEVLPIVLSKIRCIMVVNGLMKNEMDMLPNGLAQSGMEVLPIVSRKIRCRIVANGLSKNKMYNGCQ